MTTVIGITGSIGMGKTTLAKAFAAQGARVSDADKVARALLQTDAEVQGWIANHNPEALHQGAVNRAKLGAYVFQNPVALQQLEALLHPKLRHHHTHFIAQARYQGIGKVVLDIPLLFETGAELLCHTVIVASAPAWVQKRRVLARPGMTLATFNAIKARQWPDAKKRHLADTVIQTGLSLGQTRRQLLPLLAG